MGKGEFLRVFGPVQSKAVNQRIIRESFKEYGIYSVDGNKGQSGIYGGVWYNISELIALYLCYYRLHTLLLVANLSSPRLENSPPKLTETLQKNQPKPPKGTNLMIPKFQQGIEYISYRNRIATDHLAMVNNRITRNRAIQLHINRPKTEGQIK